ncbi:MAG: hypothetical protein QNJ98_20165 [Planctomycetota bacterium]|nr:hypothetical protein [Planctomycetota bacterium]
MRIPRAWWRRLVIVGLLLVTTTTPVQGGDDLDTRARQARKRARSDAALLATKLITELKEAAARVARFTLDEPEDGDLADARNALSHAERRYRAHVAYQFSLRLEGVDRAKRQQHIHGIYAREAQTLDLLRRGLARDLAEKHRVYTDDGRRAAEIGELRGQLTAAYLRVAILREMQTAVVPVVAGGIPTTVVRLKELADVIAAHDPENPIGPSEIDIDILREAARIDYELAEREFVRLAARGLIVDPGTNRPLEGKRRVEIARNAELNLAEYLRHKGKRSDVADLFSWDDTRPEIAARIEDRVKHTPEYQSLIFLDSAVEPNLGAYFRSVALAVRGEQGWVNDWYNDEFVGGEWYNVGLGKLLRVTDKAGLSGDAADAAVKRRIQKFAAESDATVAAFEAAAANIGNPAALAPEHHELLKAFGYIGERDDGTEFFVIPFAKRGVRAHVGGLKGAARLPGASWLDVITPKNVGIAAVSIVVPELAGMRVAAWVGQLGGSARAMMAARVLTEIGVGAATDAAIEAANSEDGSVEWDKILLESVLLGGVLQGVGELNQIAVREGLQEMARAQRQTRLHKRLREDADFRKKLESGLGAMLQLTTDTSLQTFYQSMVDEGDVDGYTVLATLLQGAMSQVLAKGWGDIREGDVTLRKVEKSEHMPAWLRKAVKDDPELGKELVEAIRTRIKHQDEVMARWDELTGGGENTDTARIFRHLLRGDFSWADMKRIYYKRPEQTKELRRELRDLREAYFATMVFEAQAIARRWLNDRISKLRHDAVAEAGSEAAAQDALKAIDSLHERELELIAEGVFAPGSRDPTSDIDRSSESHLLRRALIAVYESRAEVAADDGIPTSARAFDVNEYLNVMPFLKENARYVEKTQAVVLGDAAFGAVRHEHQMLALTYSAAMSSMTPEQATRYMQNLRKAMNEMVEAGSATHRDRQELEYMLDFAQQSLARTNAELGAKRQQAIERLGLDPKDPEVDRHAQEALYHERTKEIADKLWEFDVLVAQKKDLTQEGIELRAEIERLMSVALRDGIETYSSPTGIDIIVNRVQAASRRLPSGERVSMTVRDRIEDPNFTLDKDLRPYTLRDVQGMINDQVKFLVEHVNGYRTGHEWPHEVGRAMGKYLQRYFLGRRLQGFDVKSLEGRPNFDATRRLYEAAEALMMNKRDPNGINAVLADLSRKAPKSPDSGTVELLRLIEIVIPGMQGLTSREAIGRPRRPHLAKNEAHYRQQRRRKRLDLRERLKLFALLGGAALCKAELLQERAATRSQQEKLKEEIERIEAYARQYLQEDWPRALLVQDQLRGLRLLTASVPWKSGHSKTYRELSEKKTDLEKELEALKRRFKNSDIRIADRLYQRLASYAHKVDQLDWLNEKLALLDKHLTEYREKARQEAVFDRMDFSGDWGATNERLPLGTAKAQHEGDVVTLRLKWNGLPGKLPQIEIRAWHLRGRLRGRWRALHVSPFVDGLFEARFRPDGQAFQVTDRTYNDPRIPIDWPGLEFARPERAAGDAGTGWLRETTRSVPQQEEQIQPGEAPDDGFGRVTIHVRGVDGRAISAAFDVYSNGEWQGQGSLGRSQKLAPGTYDMHVEEWGEHGWVKGIRVVANQAIVVPGPQLGGVAVQLRQEDGGSRAVRFRLYKGNHRLPRPPMGTLDDKTPYRSALPGSHTVVFSIGGVTFRRDVTIEAGKVRVVDASPGGVLLQVKDVDGKRLHGLYRVFRENRPETPLASMQGLQSLDSAGTIHLPPGRYRVGITRADWFYFEPIEIVSGRFKRWEVVIPRIEIVGLGAHSDPRVVLIRRAVVDDATRSWSSSFSVAAPRLEVAPGSYDLVWKVGERTHKRTVKVGLGAHRRVDIHDPD